MAKWTFTLMVQPPLKKDGTPGMEKFSTGMYPGGVAKAKKAIRLKEPWLVYHIPPNSTVPYVSVYRGGRFHGRIKREDPDRLLQMA